MLVPYQTRISKGLKKELQDSAKENTEEGEKVNVNSEVRTILRLGLKARKEQNKLKD